MSYMRAVQVGYSTYVGRDTVVPDDDGVGLPLDAGLVVDALVDMVVEEVENGVCRCVSAYCGLKSYVAH